MTEDTEIDYDRLADSIIDRLRGLGLNRRDMLKILAGGGAGALAVSATGTASAQTINGIIKADQLGTSSEPVKELYVDTLTNYSSAETFDELNGADISDSQAAERALETDGNGGLNIVTAVTDGDGTKREIWVIANGASDPAGADPEDIILEEA